ncbi:MAG: ABC transporter ATP-binding protein [Actinomycetota bacterium]
MRFGDVDALRGFDLEVPAGKLTTLVGPSGCGKTSALRVAAGLERPDAGTVSIAGREVTTVAPAARNVAMVFQNYALFPHLSVAENIGFGLSVRRVKKEEISKRVFRAATLVGCEAQLRRLPRELSGGEQQRVALARALARDPDVFLLDEPLSNLDAQLREAMRVEILRIQSEVEGTMLYVTHDQFEALTLGERVVVMRDGTVAQQGDPEEIYNKPADLFVATFIGSPAMNVLRGRVADGDVVAAGVRIPLPTGVAIGPGSSGIVDIGIRPEHLRIAPHEGITARVESVQVAGSENHLTVSIGEERLVSRVPQGVRPSPGDEIRLLIDPGHIHLFDSATGLRLGGGG